MQGELGPEAQWFAPPGRLSPGRANPCDQSKYTDQLGRGVSDKSRDYPNGIEMHPSGSIWRGRSYGSVRRQHAEAIDDLHGA